MLGLQYTRMALDHWEEWPPTMYRDLKMRGQLKSMAQQASKEASRRVAALMEGGYQRHEAEELVLPELILINLEDRAA